MRRTWLHIQNHLHSFLPEWDHDIETSQIEVVLDKVLRNLAEIFVAWERAEPAYPCQSGCWGGRA